MKNTFAYKLLSLFLLLLINVQMLLAKNPKNSKNSLEIKWEKRLNRLQKRYKRILGIKKVEADKLIEMRKFLAGNYIYFFLI